MDVLEHYLRRMFNSGLNPCVGGGEESKRRASGPTGRVLGNPVRGGSQQRYLVSLGCGVPGTNPSFPSKSLFPTQPFVGSESGV